MARFIIYSITADAPSKPTVDKRTLTTPDGTKDYSAETVAFDDLKVEDKTDFTVTLVDSAGDKASEPAVFTGTAGGDFTPDTPSGLKVTAKGEAFA